MSKICPRYEQEETKQRRDKHLRRQHTGDAKRQGGGAAHPYQGWRYCNHKQVQAMTPSEQMRSISQIALLKAASKELHKAIDNIIVELRERVRR